MSEAKLTPYQKIMRAAKHGKGVRLSAEECGKLSLDDAIETRAEQDDFDTGVLSARLQRHAGEQPYG